MDKELSNIDPEKAVEAELNEKLGLTNKSKFKEYLIPFDADLFEVSYPKNWYIINDRIDEICYDIQVCSIYKTGFFGDEITFEDISCLINNMNSKPILTLRPKSNDRSDISIHVIDMINKLPTEEFHKIMNDVVNSNSPDVKIINKSNNTQKFAKYDINICDATYEVIKSDNNFEQVRQLRVNYLVDSIIYSIRYKSIYDKFSLNFEDAKKVIRSFRILE